MMLGGCAFGRRISYDGATNISPKFQKDIPVLVLFHDVRPYVLSKNKGQNFVGLTRSLYGIPYPTTTASGNPLADDYAHMIVRNLEGRGFSASTTHIAPFATDEEIRSVITQYTYNSGAALLFVIREWKTDAYFHLTLHYDITLEVYNHFGKLLVSTKQKGEDKIAKNLGRKRSNLANAVNDIIGSLINDKKVLACIQSLDSSDNSRKAKSENIKIAKTVGISAKGQEIAPSAKDHKCTKKQILAMKKMGLTKEQIQAACK